MKTATMTNRAALAALAALAAAGCATPQRYADSRAAYEQGDYPGAVAAIQSDIPDHYAPPEEGKEPRDDKDKYVLDDLIVASAFQADRDYATAREMFDKAETGIAAQEERGLASKTGHLIAQIFAGDAAAPYKVAQYDRILLNTYKAVGHAAEGDMDAARVEFRRAEERQRLCTEYFAKEIAAEKAEQRKLLDGSAVKENEAEEGAEKAEGEKKSKAAEYIDKFKAQAMEAAMAPVRRVMEDPAMKESLDAYAKSVDGLGTYAGWTVPAATFEKGLFLTLYGEDADDFEEASKIMGELSAVSPSAAVKGMFAEAEDRANKKSGKAKDFVWVVYENGMAPRKAEFKFVIPVPVDGLPLATIALPTLQAGTDAYPQLSLCDGETELGKTELLCNMDAVIGREFATRRTGIITRMAIGAILKTAVSAAIAKSVEDSVIKNGGSSMQARMARLLVQQAMNALWFATTHADLRNWDELPKNVQIALVPRPASGELTIAVPGGTRPLAKVKLADGAANVVRIRIPSAWANPTVELTTAPAGKAPDKAVAVFGGQAEGEYVAAEPTVIEYKPEAQSPDYAAEFAAKAENDAAEAAAEADAKAAAETPKAEETKTKFGLGKFGL